MTDKLLFTTSPHGIATLTLNFPERRNAYDQDVLDGIAHHCKTLGADPAIRAIVLRGVGEHFSAGADVKWHAEQRRNPAPVPSVFDICEVVNTTPKPTIAVVRGVCAGGALALASSCDILIAATDAVFAIPEVRLGFPPGPSSAPVFIRAVGLRAFRRLGMTGQKFSAEEALRNGLAHEICSPQELEARLAAQIDEILLSAPIAAGKTKLLAVRVSRQFPSPEALAELAPMFAGAMDSPEAAEGRASFIEKRRPNWYVK
ncbi:MAG: enoyl-CoA hydratase/isomerase family protein [Betaproteobacteria bacterium]|nr:enoyl-CoA hydratase/isomerase family protein [Betaproteobacteria bacterium]